MSDIKLFEDLEYTNPDEVKLSRTLALSELPLELPVRDFYGGVTVNQKLMGTIINSMYVHRRCTFLFSKKIFSDLLQKDSNVTRDTISGVEYKKFLGFVLGNKILLVLRQSSSFSDSSRRGFILALNADVLKDTHEFMVKQIGLEYLIAQAKATLRYYDGDHE